MKLSRFFVVPIVVVVLAGCSDSDSTGDDGATTEPGSTSSAEPDSSGSPSPSPVPSGPECSDVWVDGEILPADYAGCLVGGEAGIQDEYPCLDGTTLVVFDNAFYAVTGGQINEPDIAPLQDTEEYGAAYAECTGE